MRKWSEPGRFGAHMSRKDKRTRIQWESWCKSEYTGHRHFRCERGDQPFLSETIAVGLKIWAWALLE